MLGYADVVKERAAEKYRPRTSPGLLRGCGMSHPLGRALWCPGLARGAPSRTGSGLLRGCGMSPPLGRDLWRPGLARGAPRGGVTLSEAAHRAGLTVWEMETYLVDRGYTSDYSVEDLERERARLR